MTNLKDLIREDIINHFNEKESDGTPVIQPKPVCKVNFDAHKELSVAEVAVYFSEIEKYLYPKSRELEAIGTKVFFNAFKSAYQNIKKDIILRNYFTKPLSGRKAKLIIDDTEYTVTLE